MTLIVLCRLHDVCTRVGCWKPKPRHIKPCISLGVPHILQWIVGSYTTHPALPVLV